MTGDKTAVEERCSVETWISCIRLFDIKSCGQGLMPAQLS